MVYWAESIYEHETNFNFFFKVLLTNNLHNVTQFQTILNHNEICLITA